VSRDKKFQLRVDQDFLDWFDDQIKAHNLDPNRSEIAIRAIEEFFKNLKDLKVINLPDDAHRRLDEYVRTRSTKTTASSVIYVALMDYLDRH
jgi:metal-responsive CopG/Arc/MetJ family transcriptional regulator